MTGPANSTTNKTTGHRTYTWRGDTYQSVTTILSAIPKPALVPWAARTVAEGAIHAFQNGSLHQMIAQDPAAATQFLKGLPYGARDRSGDAGTLIHRWVEARILGAEPPVIPVQLRPQLETFQRFEADYQPTWVASEVTVYNRTEVYAGTCDAIVEIDGRTLMIDLKTGKGVYPEYALQLTAYTRGEFIGGPDGEEHPVPPIHGAAVLHLRPRSYRLVEVATTDEMWRSFLYAREVLRWQREVSSRALLDAVTAPGEDRVARAVELFGAA